MFTSMNFSLFIGIFIEVIRNTKLNIMKYRQSKCVVAYEVLTLPVFGILLTLSICYRIGSIETVSVLHYRKYCQCQCVTVYEVLALSI